MIKLKENEIFTSNHSALINIKDIINFATMWIESVLCIRDPAYWLLIWVICMLLSFQYIPLWWRAVSPHILTPILSYWSLPNSYPLYLSLLSMIRLSYQYWPSYLLFHIIAYSTSEHHPHSYQYGNHSVAICTAFVTPQIQRILVSLRKYLHLTYYFFA